MLFTMPLMLQFRPKLISAKIVTMFIMVTILVFEITPISSLSAVLAMKINEDYDKISLVNYKITEKDHITIGIVTADIAFFSLDPLSSSLDKERKNKLMHSTFRIRADVINALDREAQRRGISLSSLVNKTLENYVTSEMYFEELGFILVSKDFLRKTFSGLNEKDLEGLGRSLGLTVAKEYVSYFFPEVNFSTLLKFLDLWFKRFQSYQHRFDDGDNDSDDSKDHHYFMVNHDINMNFSIVLKAMLEGLMEPIIKRTVTFRNLTPCSITFSFEGDN
jgi:hypothetical protein